VEGWFLKLRNRKDMKSMKSMKDMKNCNCNSN